MTDERIRDNFQDCTVDLGYEQATSHLLCDSSSELSSSAL